MAELWASAPMNIVEILLFGRPVIIEGGGFDLFSKDPDLVEDIENLFKNNTANLKIDYLSLNLQLNNIKQIQEIADFLADTFDIRFSRI